MKRIKEQKLESNKQNELIQQKLREYYLNKSTMNQTFNLENEKDDQGRRSFNFKKNVAKLKPISELNNKRENPVPSAMTTISEVVGNAAGSTNPRDLTHLRYDQALKYKHPSTSKDKFRAAGKSINAEAESKTLSKKQQEEFWASLQAKQYILMTEKTRLKS